MGHTTSATGPGSKKSRDGGGGKEGLRPCRRQGAWWGGAGRGGAGHGNGSEVWAAGLEGGGGTGICRRRRYRPCSNPFRVSPAGLSAAMMIHGFQSSHQDFSFGPWKLTASKTHIMKSADVEK